MEFCLLCLEIRNNFLESIKANSVKWQELNVSELIEKHFWPLSSMLTPSTSDLCLTCWQELYSFHKFYVRVEKAHINFGTLIKVGDTSQTLESAKHDGNYNDEKEHFAYSLMEPEMLIDDPTKKEEIEIEKLPTIKIEPQNTIFDDIPIKDTCIVLESDNTLPNRDPLEKPIKPRDTLLSMKKVERSRKKVGARGSTAKPITEQISEVQEIKLESDNFNKQDNNYADNSEDNYQSDSDSPRNMKRKKQRTYYENRKNRKKDDQLIANPFGEITCDLCKTNFKSFPALREHFAVTHKQKGYVICCNKKFFNRTRLFDHIHSHLNPDHFKCKECGKVMSDRNCLGAHILRVHRANEIEKKYCCDVCSKLFLNEYTLRKHKLTHLSEDEKKFPCSECGKSYGSSYLLRQHTHAVHMKKFVKICYICGKFLSTSADYNAHMNKHEGIPAPIISCDVCGLRLTTERGLKRHKDTQHPIGGKQDHCCPICPKISPTLKALRKHISTMHEKGYDYKCNICDKAFKRAEVLREHIASHTGTILYTCPWCPKTFKSNGNMHAHRKKVHPKEWEEAKLQKYCRNIPRDSLVSEQNNTMPYFLCNLTLKSC